MKFYLNKVYYTKISAATFGNLPESKIEKIFTDGRYISPFIEAFVDQNFDNINYVPGNKSWDYKYDATSTDKPLELRGFPLQAKTANLIPSNMIGAGRVYNQKKYVDKLLSLSGYIFVYPLLNYKHLLVFGYSAQKIVNTTPLLQKLDRKDVENILGVSPKSIYEHMTDASNVCVVENNIYEVDTSKIKS